MQDWDKYTNFTRNTEGGGIYQKQNKTKQKHNQQ
jgi:hypothetical protein